MSESVPARCRISQRAEMSLCRAATTSEKGETCESDDNFSSDFSLLLTSVLSEVTKQPSFETSQEALKTFLLISWLFTPPEQLHHFHLISPLCPHFTSVAPGWQDVRDVDEELWGNFRSLFERHCFPQTLLTAPLCTESCAVSSSSRNSGALMEAACSEFWTFVLIFVLIFPSCASWTYLNY